MKRILNVITTENLVMNENGFFDTTNIIYSVCYDDETMEEFTSENVPEEILDFIYYATEYNETYSEKVISGLPGETDTRETIYFNK